MYQVSVVVGKDNVKKLDENKLVGADTCPVCETDIYIDFFDNYDEINAFIKTGLCQVCQKTGGTK